MESPRLCSNGTYANITGSSGCETCPAGYKCGDPRMSPTPCPDGSYSGAGALYCLECPAGYRYVKDFYFILVLIRIYNSPISEVEI